MSETPPPPTTTAAPPFPFCERQADSIAAAEARRKERRNEGSKKATRFFNQIQIS